jgi:hypothetical protein
MNLMLDTAEQMLDAGYTIKYDSFQGFEFTKTFVKY